MDENKLRAIYAHYQTLGCFLPWEEFQEKVQLAYTVLTERASQTPYGQLVITYGALGNKIGLFPLSDWFHLKIPWIVGACSLYEYQEGRPLISAMVVNAETYQPGNGFWALQGIHGPLRKAVKVEDFSPFEISGERERFWINELKRIDKCWKTKKQDSDGAGV